jgi:CRISPR-associated endonuclease Csn1
MDFVITGNNHHVAIYEDANGDYQEQVVSFFEAVERSKKNSNLPPVIDKTFNQENGWKFKYTLKQNEYFVLMENGVHDLSDLDITDPKNHEVVSKWLYRVQKITSKDYFLLD